MTKVVGTILLLSGGLISIFIGLYFPNIRITEMKHSRKDIRNELNEINIDISE